MTSLASCVTYSRCKKPPASPSLSSSGSRVATSSADSDLCSHADADGLSARYTPIAVEGKQERQRADQVRRARRQGGLLLQRRGNQPNAHVLHVPQPTVNEPGRPAGCSAGVIVLLDERDTPSLPGRFPGDRGARDSAAHDEDVELLPRQLSESDRPSIKGGRPKVACEPHGVPICACQRATHLAGRAPWMCSPANLMGSRVEVDYGVAM